MKQKQEQFLKTLEKKLKSLRVREKALKEAGNILYGCLGSDFFLFQNKNIAQSITQQGKSILLFTNKKIQDYFTKIFHKDKKLHNYLGIKITKKIESELIIYNDNDSIFLDLGTVISATNYSGDAKLFIKKLFDYRLNNLLNSILNSYAKRTNVDNKMTLKVECVFSKFLPVSKKTYVYTVDNCVGATGFDTISKSTPPFIKKELNKVIKILFDGGNVYEHLFEIYNNIKLQSIENLSELIFLNVELKKYIIDQQTKIVLKKNAPYHVQGVATYNYLLKQSKLEKYKFIENGENIRVYLTESGHHFAFIPNMFPYEFAPKINYKKVFEKHILNPTNKLLKAANKNVVDINYIIKNKLLNEYTR